MKKFRNIDCLRTGAILAYCSIFICLSSCEKQLEPALFGTIDETSFFKTEQDAKAAVSAMYTGMMTGWSGGWGSAQGSYSTQALQTTDEGLCNWDDGGRWVRMNRLDFDPDFSAVTDHYTSLMRYVSQITANLSKIQPIQMDEALKGRYLAELKALRGYYMQLLYLYYGPVPARLNPDEINNPDAQALPRPTKDEMVGYIIQDFTDAIAVLPDRFTGADYGRFSKAACYTSLLKLYMQEKRWSDAITAGQAIKAMGFSLTPNYEDNFNINAKGGNTEIILPIVCSAAEFPYANMYLPHYLPSDYYDASVSGFGFKWGGYRMPWKTYDRFEPGDYRLNFVMRHYPTLQNGAVVYRDARAGGDIGAVMVKYGPDPSKVNEQNSGIDYVVMRYADVVLLLAEAINENNGGPNQEAYDLLNDVRTKHGKLAAFPAGSLNQTQFRDRIKNERLFELWAEGVRRDDLIRWGQYIQRAKDDGHAVSDHVIWYPLPRSVVSQSNGVIAQNPGYN